jgi:hypothetical protein
MLRKEERNYFVNRVEESNSVAIDGQRMEWNFK